MDRLDSKREFDILSFIRKSVIRRIRVSKFFFSIFLLLFAFSLVYLIIQIRSVKNSNSTFDSAIVSAEFQIADAQGTANDIISKAEEEAAKIEAKEKAKKKAEEEAKIKAENEEKQKLSSSFAPYSSPNDFPITLSTYELDLLCRLVEAESGDQSKIGKQAVVWVVLNRLSSPRFPDTVERVIYARGQFDPAESGSIEYPAAKSTKAAVKEVLAGNVGDPTNGAVYFCELDSIPNPNTRRWFEEELTCLAVIGCHHFYI